MTEETDQARSLRESTIVNKYLEFLERRGSSRRRDPERIELRIVEIKRLLESDALTPVQRIDLVQERTDLQAEYVMLTDDCEREFKQIIKSWAERRGVTYGTLREVGVPAHVLREAGMSSRG